MKSIGNDIVDLNFIDRERTLQYQFYSKFLSVSEQRNTKERELAQMPFEVYAWLLWSAKEAIYKFAKRLQPDLIFSPINIILKSEFTELSEPEFSELKNFHNSDNEFQFGPFFNSINPGSKLSFIFQNKTYYTRSVITSAYIATIANDTPDFNGFQTGVNKIAQTDYQSQSAGVRRFLLKRLTVLSPNQSFTITKSKTGYPVIENSGPGTGIIASFAHHGNYVAYAFKTA